jgi:hypothetical protein
LKPRETNILERATLYFNYLLMDHMPEHDIGAEFPRELEHAEVAVL